MDAVQREKKRLLLLLLDAGAVMIHLDARHPEVRVPERFRTDPELRLNLDYAFRLPDFHVGESGIVASLSFSGQRFLCTVPFAAIWGITRTKDNQTTLFPSSIPPEVLTSLVGQEDSPFTLIDESAEAPPEETPREPMPLRLVVSHHPEEPVAEKKQDPSSRRAHLRLIKPEPES
jgi:hypothetical protein